MTSTLRALTLDLWGTILWSREPEAKVERRMELVLQTLHRAGHVYDRPVIEAAWRTSVREADRWFRHSLQDLGPRGRWELFGRHLGVDPSMLPLQELMALYEQLTINFPPNLMPAVKEVVGELSQSYALGLICNSGFAPGSTLRQVLAHHGLLDVFQVLTFSDEFGRLKPDPAIFHHTLQQLGVAARQAAHVGDLEELDVEGAHAAGLRAARYDYFEGYVDGRRKPPSQAEVVFRDWREFPALLDRLAGAAE
ncbi:MAG: HAD family hydrolase [Chloroflexi bacterium]|nr:HAD family hydrolase [Chloroflexota bacterium]